eukprot:gene24972-10632_t
MNGMGAGEQAAEVAPPWLGSEADLSTIPIVSGTAGDHTDQSTVSDTLQEQSMTLLECPKSLVGRDIIQGLFKGFAMLRQVSANNAAIAARQPQACGAPSFPRKPVAQSNNQLLYAPGYGLIPPNQVCTQTRTASPAGLATGNGDAVQLAGNTPASQRLMDSYYQQMQDGKSLSLAGLSLGQQQQQYQVDSMVQMAMMDQQMQQQMAGPAGGQAQVSARMKSPMVPMNQQMFPMNQQPQQYAGVGGAAGGMPFPIPTSLLTRAAAAAQSNAHFNKVSPKPNGVGAGGQGQQVPGNNLGRQQQYPEGFAAGGGPYSSNADYELMRNRMKYSMGPMNQQMNQAQPYLGAGDAGGGMPFPIPTIPMQSVSANGDAKYNTGPPKANGMGPGGQGQQVPGNNLGRQQQYPEWFVAGGSPYPSNADYELVRSDMNANQLQHNFYGGLEQQGMAGMLMQQGGHLQLPLGHISSPALPSLDSLGSPQDCGVRYSPEPL